MKEEKQKFIDIMERIRIGSIIFYHIDFGSEKTSTLKVHSIEHCNGGSHEGCRYCKGYVNRRCFKKANSWQTDIIEVIDSDFITIEEMKI